MTQDERLFDPDEYPALVPQPDLRLVRHSGDQLAMAGGARHLLPDDENSFSRPVPLHSADKDHFVFSYEDIVSRALVGRGRFPAVCVIELFAGPGRLFVEDTEQFRAGSPVRALEVARPFDHYVFNDISKVAIEALRPRVEGGANVSVTQLDANSPLLFRHIVECIPRRALVICYADPEGLHLEFDTLARLAAYFPYLDLLINFPVKQIIRALRGEEELAARQRREADVEKAARVLGHDRPLSLVAGPRHTWGPTIRDYFENRLRGIGYDQFDTEVIHLHSKNVAIYDLLLASHDPLAVKFFQQARHRGPGGQMAMGLKLWPRLTPRRRPDRPVVDSTPRRLGIARPSSAGARPTV